MTLLFLLLLWGLASISSFIYLRKVNNRIIYYKKRYKGTDNYLGASVGKVNKIRKVMMIVVVDSSKKVIECDYLYGFTNLSQFKRKEEFINIRINEINQYKYDKFYDVFKTTLSQIKIE